MKKIFLIGDSIRFGASCVPPSPGYGVFVKEMRAHFCFFYKKLPFFLDFCKKMPFFTPFS